MQKWLDLRLGSVVPALMRCQGIEIWVVPMRDYQDGVPGRGDHVVIPGMWYSIELQATTKVPEWGNQPVRSMQEEDVIIDRAGKVRWAFGRQTKFHLVR